MKHIKQKQGLGTCGAVAYAAILELTELQGIRECQTKMTGRDSGTATPAVRAAFFGRGIMTHDIDLDGRTRLQNVFWIVPLSKRCPLYVVTSTRKNGSTHAVAIADGRVYDGHENESIPIEFYKNAWVERVILVDRELSTYQGEK